MSKHIMLIDDDEIFQQVVRRCCRKLPEVDLVTTASDGAEGLDVLEAILENDDRIPDVVFVDVNMPVLDGFGFLRGFAELRQKHESLLGVKPIAMLTSSEQESDKVHALELGADAYLVKGVGMDEVRESIAGCVR